MKGKKNNNHLKTNLISLKVGFFLALRQIRRTSHWTNVLVICIMTLTFLNLIVVSGILVGLIEGAVEAVKTRYLGEVFISNLKDRAYIDRSQEIINVAKNLPGVKALSARYIESGIIESDYKIPLKPKELERKVGTSFAGISPEDENQTTKISDLIIEGQFLEENDYDQIVVGALLLKKYLDFESPNFPILDNVEIGTRVRIEINGNQREVIVKGILKSKVDEIDRRVFFTEKQLRALIGRYDYNVDEIAIRLDKNADAKNIKNSLIEQDFDNYATIQTQEDAEPKFIKDMKKTFDTLGNVISSIGLVVAAITIFIVIFINAVTRRKYIGIMKGIGIKTEAIEFAYIFQSFFYAVLGITFGSIIVFAGLVPYIHAHPINFPFSDGILVVSLSGTIIRIIILLVATVIAGYIPAKIITKQNTVDAILNR